MKNHSPTRSQRRRTWGAAAALLALSLTGLTACGGGDEAADGDGEKILRVAMGSPGEAQMAVWEGAADQFEAANEGWEVELNFMDDDQYQTVGLPNLLKGRQAPDLYFEWVGDRLATRAADGFAADLSPYVDSTFQGIWNPGLFEQTTVDGKVAMIPHMADVTTVLWYNKKLYADNGLTPPTTMAELLDNCATFQAKKIPTISLGNKDLWPAGNFFSQIASRVVGPDVYDSTLKGDTSFDHPAWLAALEEVKTIADAGCVNDSASAINDNEGAQLFFQGKAAMHPIGSWLVSWAVSEAPDLDFDFVNIPPVEGGAGDQTSVMGVMTGFVINDKSENKDQAAEFMALVNSPDNVNAFIAAEAVPLALAAAENDTIDERTARLGELLATSGTIISPPDTGYDIERANALYQAIAVVMGGESTPAEAQQMLVDETS